MEAGCSYEMAVNIYQITQGDIPEDINLHSCCHENFKSLIYLIISLFTSTLNKKIVSHKMGTTGC
jgi:hypothetical protein